MEDFVSKVAEILEVESISLDEQFREVPDWDSVKGLGLIVMMNDDYQVEISVDEFKASRTVRDLAELAKVQD